MPPIYGLSWWWYWVLILVPDPEKPSRSRQLMTLWSTKETKAVRVSGHWWEPGTRMHKDENGGFVIPGMVCAWWYDGEKMHEPYLMREARIAALDGQHPDWPGSGEFSGSGAVVPVTDSDLSMGMADDGSHFWLRCKGDDAAIAGGAPESFDLKITPWTKAASSAAYSNNVFGNDMGYDIIRLHACRCQGEIDGRQVQGSAYFQKVTVQAPSIPWFWGFLHFSDGTYLDWFIPHISFSMTARDERAWKLRDVARVPLRTAGLFHDEKRGRSEKFERCEVELISPDGDEVTYDSHGSILPRFKIRVWNGRTQIGLQVKAANRAHWTFNQPTRAGLVSHLTYNEYPLEVESLTILDERGIRTLDDFEWVHGNAEHAWGLLH